MGRIGFWQLLLDSNLSWWEAQRINEAHDAADVAWAHAESASAAASSADKRLAMMSREIVMLRSALTVLVQTLKDTKVVDDRLLDARLEAAMEEATAAFKAQDARAIPNVNEMMAKGSAPLPNVKLTCLKCRKQVPASTTIMTVDGPVCERC